MFEAVFENILNVFEMIPVWFSHIRLIGFLDLWEFIIIIMCMSAILPVIVVTIKTGVRTSIRRSARERRRANKESGDSGEDS